MKEINLDYKRSELTEIEAQAQHIRLLMDRRRSVRHFSSEPVPRHIIEDLLMTAGSAPSGANKQPWHFCAVNDALLKQKIREAAEKEEYINYHGRMSETWLQDLEALGTDWQKPFLETAPWLIIVFRQSFQVDAQGKNHKNYYVNESVGIACGFLIAAIHQAGLCCLTHTPSPMDFLSEILGRPTNEKPFLLLPVGYAENQAKVPDIKRKSTAEIISWY